jgi:uncharacterized membrane protein YccF (DUF307 family)
MSLLGNILWLIFGGFGTAVGYLTMGLGYCVTLIGIPWGVQAIKLGVATLLPFGLEVRESRDAGGMMELIANLIWVIVAGWAIALHHLLWALLLAITVVGLPFAAQHMKLVPLALFPFGKELR